MSTLAQPMTDVDVAIVGGGCAGLYCAWRLALQPVRPTTYVFEKEPRIGGRLLSVDMLPAGRKAELGGMRFTPEHKLLNAAIDKLSATIRGESPLEKCPFEFSTKLMFLRGKYLRYDDQEWQKHLRYSFGVPRDKVDKWNVSNVALEMTRTAIERSLAKAKIDMDGLPGRIDMEGLSGHLETLRGDINKKCLTSAQWRQLQLHATINGINLYSLGFWNLLQHSLHEFPDEFLFLHDALGYESLVANSNAAQSIPVFLADFDDPKYVTLKGGMEAFPRILAFQARLRLDCSIADHHAVESVRKVEKDGISYFELSVRCTPSASNPKISYCRTYTAKKVILALPKAPLMSIKFEGFESDELSSFQSQLGKVTAHPAFKLFLRYERPWWRNNLGALEARAVTDLPIRQVYYMGEKDDPEGPALVMASYSDEHYVDFWEPLVKDPKAIFQAWEMEEYGMSRTKDRSANAASRRVIDKAEAQLALMHRGVEIPPSQIGVVKQWSDAWHFWNVHAKPWETAEKLVRPFKDLDLFVCGEAYSLEQGWVEGALKSAERVLHAMGTNPPNDDKDHVDYITH